MKPTVTSDNYTLYYADCLDVLPTLEAGSVDAVITDPPYNVGINYTGYSDKKEYNYYRDWCHDWLSKLLVISPLVVLTPGVMNYSMWQKFNPKWSVIWVKPNQCSPSALNGWNVWEPILFFGKNHKPIGQDVFIIPIRTNQKDVGDHPCPKDLRAWTVFVESFFFNGCTILDPFMGSGTTGVAALRTGRRFIGIELEREYFDIAHQRITNAAGDFMTTDKEREAGQMALWDLDHS